MKELAKNMANRMKEEHQKNLDFYHSETFHTILKAFKDKQASVDNEYFAYFPEKVKAQLGLEDISDNDIKMFFTVMHKQNIGVEDMSSVETDEDNGFENYSFIKQGLFVSVMFGQGCAIFISTKPQDNK